MKLHNPSIHVILTTNNPNAYHQQLQAYHHHKDWLLQILHQWLGQGAFAGKCCPVCSLFQEKHSVRKINVAIKKFHKQDDPFCQQKNNKRYTFAPQLNSTFWHLSLSKYWILVTNIHVAVQFLHAPHMSIIQTKSPNDQNSLILKRYHTPPFLHKVKVCVYNPSFVSM